jgi:hypothetical protein
MATRADAAKEGSKSAKHRVRNQRDYCVLQKQDGHARNYRIAPSIA